MSSLAGFVDILIRHKDEQIPELVPIEDIYNEYDWEDYEVASVDSVSPDISDDAIEWMPIDDITMLPDEDVIRLKLFDTIDTNITNTDITCTNDFNIYIDGHGFLRADEVVGVITSSYAEYTIEPESIQTYTLSTEYGTFHAAGTIVQH